MNLMRKNIFVASFMGGAVCLAAHGQSTIQLQVAPAAFGLFQPHAMDNFTTINAAFAPDGRTVYFSKSHAGWSGLTIFESNRKGAQWSDPEVAQFSGIFADTDPAISSDGVTVIFASRRDSQGQSPKNYSLFRINLAAKTLSAEPLGAAINDGSSTLYPSLARDGTLYFVRNVGNTVRILRSELVHGEYSTPTTMNIPGDTDTVFDSDPTIAPDQSFVVFSSNRPDSLGSNDLYLSFRRQNEWCAPIHFDAPINSPSAELATALSVDGRTLYFASARNAFKLPRTTRVTAAKFRSETAAYENGTLRMYQVNLGPWLDAHRPQSQSCTSTRVD